MAALFFRVPPQWDGQRLDSFLRRGHGVSAAQLKRAKARPGGLCMDGAPIRTIDPVRAGALVALDVGEEHCFYPPSSRPVGRVYESSRLVAFNKPPGMATHPAKGHPGDTLANVFAALYHPPGGGMAFRPVSRLDLDTSGALLVAKDAYAARVAAAGLEKEYLALVSGILTPSQGCICLPIARQELPDHRRVVQPGGQPARTCYQTLASRGGMSLVRLRLVTGRTHQIRVHLAAVGCPVAGDRLYGGDCSRLHRQALHCWQLSFDDPAAKGRVQVRAPLFADMQAAVEDLFGCGGSGVLW